MHVHAAEDRNSYYLEQLCTIGICGLLGGVSIMLYRQGLLRFILADKFHGPVLWGGIALLVMVALRAVSLWGEAGSAKAAAHEHHHDHDHDHAHDHDHDHAGCAGHDHDHAHCDHDHDHDHAHDHEHEHAHEQLGGHHHHDDHGHDHGWNPWRYIVLLLPVVLFFLGFPNEALTARNTTNLDDVDLAARSDVGKPGGDVLTLDFTELQKATYTTAQRDYWKNKTVRIKGQFVPDNNSARVFSLVRYRIQCCAADAVPLNVVIVSPEELPVKSLLRQWVEVTGVVDFRKKGNREEYVTVLQTRSPSDVKVVPPDANPFLQ